MTEDQQSLVELIRDFMTREVKPHVLEWEKEGHYPKEIIQMGIDMGLHMMQVPEEYGGMGLDTTTTAMMIEEGAKVEYSILMPGTVVKAGASISYAIVAEKAVIGAGAKVGAPPDPEGASEDWGIAVVAEGIKVGDGATVAPKAMVTRNVKGGAAK